MNNNHARYAWDYDITQEQFDEMLAGRREIGHLNRDWAAVRVIENSHCNRLRKTQ